MKKIIVMLLLWTAYSGEVCLAQKIIKKSFPYHKGMQVTMNLKFGDTVRVHAWNKPEIYLKASVEINKNKLNDALIMKTDQTGRSLDVSTDFDKQMIKNADCDDCSGNRTIHTRGSVICSHIYYDIYAPAGTDLTLKSISANMIIRNMTGPVYAKTISGFVDMNWPKERGADVSLKSISGELYSNLNIHFFKPQKNGPVGGISIGWNDTFRRTDDSPGIDQQQYLFEKPELKYPAKCFARTFFLNFNYIKKALHFGRAFILGITFSIIHFLPVAPDEQAA